MMIDAAVDRATGDHLKGEEFETYRKLSGDRKAGVDRHLVKCVRCRQELTLFDYHLLLGALFEKDIENGRIRDFG